MKMYNIKKSSASFIIVLFFLFFLDMTNAFATSQSLAAFNDLSINHSFPKITASKLETSMAMEGAIPRKEITRKVLEDFGYLKDKGSVFGTNIAFLLIIGAMLTEQFVTPEMIATQKKQAREYHSEVLVKFRSYPKRIRYVGYVLHDIIVFSITFSFFRSVVGVFPVILGNVSAYTVFPTMRKMRHIGGYKALEMLQSFFSKPKKLISELTRKSKE
mmetsp:Transcript_692/g.884  ORF Transcript_692/g.884 Transcript_692/m.884 type:complete len:216 (+) Transcript_692:112-759(+)